METKFSIGELCQNRYLLHQWGCCCWNLWHMECLRLKQDSRSILEGSMPSFLIHKDIYHYFNVLQIKQQKLIFETNSLWVIELIDQWIQECNNWKLASNSFLHTKFLQSYMVTQNDKNVVLKNYNQYVVAPSWWLYNIGGVI
jgi:hypothetical protein